VLYPSPLLAAPSPRVLVFPWFPRTFVDLPVLLAGLSILMFQLPKSGQARVSASTLTDFPSIPEPKRSTEGPSCELPKAILLFWRSEAKREREDWNLEKTPRDPKTPTSPGEKPSFTLFLPWCLSSFRALSLVPFESGIRSFWRGCLVFCANLYD